MMAGQVGSICVRLSNLLGGWQAHGLLALVEHHLLHRLPRLGVQIACVLLIRFINIHTYIHTYSTYVHKLKSPQNT